MTGFLPMEQEPPPFAWAVDAEEPTQEAQHELDTSGMVEEDIDW